MSWWELEGDEVMGDRAADALAGALEALPSKPTVQQLADAIASALSTGGQHGTPCAAFSRLVLDTKEGAHAESTGAAPNTFTAGVQAGLSAVSDAYRQRWDRDPSLNELLESFRFVLGSDATRFLADATRIDTITAKPL